MKNIAERIEEMSKCHKEVMSRIGKVEESLEKYRRDGNIVDLKLTLDVFLLYMRNTVQRHKLSEEDVLFPFLRTMDYPENDIDILMNDHEEIHQNVETLNILKEMDYTKKGEVESRVEALTKGLREHIKREEKVLRQTMEITEGKGRTKHV